MFLISWLFSPERTASSDTSDAPWWPRHTQLIPEDPLKGLPKLDMARLRAHPNAHNPELLKEWVLTAFIAPQDNSLLMLSSENVQQITQILMQISNWMTYTLDEETRGNAYTRYANRPFTPTVGHNLFTMLFAQPQWLGVAINLMKSRQLSIDLLNTLIQWQGIYLQFATRFGPASVVLKFVSKETPLDDYTGEGLSPTQINIHTLSYLQVNLTVEQVNQIKEWRDPSRGVFGMVDNLVSAFTIKSKDTISFQIPSSVLFENYLKTKCAQNATQKYVVPLYCFGRLCYADMVALAIWGGRVMQHYLPNASDYSNMLRAHNIYYGEFSSTHDALHLKIIYLLKWLEATPFEHLILSGIIANCLGLHSPYEANKLIDTDDVQLLDLYLFEFRERSGKKNELSILIKNIFLDVGIYTGVSLQSPHCIANDENNYIIEFNDNVGRRYHYEMAINNNFEPLARCALACLRELMNPEPTVVNNNSNEQQNYYKRPLWCSIT